MRIADLPVGAIRPSPYQNRKHFAEDALRQLAESIKRDGLVEPIVVRPIGGDYELIAGERRLRATKTFAPTILARIVDADDLTARRMCAAENMQRADLSAVEEIACLVEVVDAELYEDGDYRASGDTPVARVRRILVALDSDRKNRTTKVSNKFVAKVGEVFGGLPRPKDWQSFLNHDLPLITSIDAEVLDLAIENRLNKSQTKALAEMAKTAPQVLADIVGDADDGHVSVRVRNDMGALDEVPLHELSARDMKTLTVMGADYFEKKRATLETLNTGDMEGYTPAEYIEAAREVMGSIDVDPASNTLAQEVVQAAIYYTAANSGLDKEWVGNVFLNPPYNLGLIDVFLDKLLSEVAAARATQAIVLTNNNTDTGWFHKTAAVADMVCLTRGRIHFYKPDRSSVSPTNGQAFFYFGPRRDEFLRVFSNIGLVMVKA